MQNISLRELQNTVDQWIKNHGVPYFSDLTQAIQKNLEKKTLRDKNRHIHNQKFGVKPAKPIATQQKADP
jgi:hypothetical protein